MFGTQWLARFACLVIAPASAWSQGTIDLATFQRQTAGTGGAAGMIDGNVQTSVDFRTGQFLEASIDAADAFGRLPIILEFGVTLNP